MTDWNKFTFSRRHWLWRRPTQSPWQQEEAEEETCWKEENYSRSKLERWGFWWSWWLVVKGLILVDPLRFHTPHNPSWWLVVRGLTITIPRDFILRTLIPLLINFALNMCLKPFLFSSWLLTTHLIKYPFIYFNLKVKCSYFVPADAFYSNFIETFVTWVLCL